MASRSCSASPVPVVSAGSRTSVVSVTGPEPACDAVFVWVLISCSSGVLLGWCSGWGRSGAVVGAGERRQQGEGSGDGVAAQRVDVAAAHGRRGDEAVLAQALQVVADQGLRQAGGGGELGDRGVAVGDREQDGQPVLVRERLENRGDPACPFSGAWGGGGSCHENHIFTNSNWFQQFLLLHWPQAVTAASPALGAVGREA